MAKLRGTNLSSPIVPFTDQDTYATHLAQFGKGGYRTVGTIAERNAIPEARLEEGMLVWVITDPADKHLYQYINSAWVSPKFDSNSSGIGKVADVTDLTNLDPDEYGDFVYVQNEGFIYVRTAGGQWVPIGVGGEITLVPAGGIPIYTKELYDQVEIKPTDYITIPSENELYQTTPEGNGFYIDILFDALRSLQAEVARLRNSFTYGINSYTGKDTAMSRVVSEASEEEGEEPLWATTEADLSEISGITTSLSNDHEFKPLENAEVLNNGLKITGEATWIDDLGFIKSTEDSKLYLYLTTSGTNIQLGLLDLDSEADETLDLSQLGIPRSDRYNILVILSREVEISGTTAAENYMWVSVSNFATGEVTNEGYWNPATNRLSTKKVNLPAKYRFYSVTVTDLTIYKFDFYSKYQDFSGSVIPSTPSDQDYKYKVAHITIRSVSNYAELKSIEDQLPKNELIYNEESGVLYIKTATRVKAISGNGGGGGSDEPGGDTSGMEKSEIIEWLAKNGIVVTDEGGELKLQQIADITFVHQGTGKMFKYEADAEGKLHATELPGSSYTGTGGILSVANFDPETEAKGLRGFVGTLGHNQLISENKALAVDKDHGLYSDRVKIGAIYAPQAGQTTFGCSHAYIELENTSDKDFLLTGCYLHYATGISGSAPDITAYHLALEGVIPAGGTYLVRGKQYTDPSQSNCFINVATYDKEWYVGEGELIDLTIGSSNTYLLTYGLPDLEWTAVMWENNPDTATKSKATYIYDPHYIDSVSLGTGIYNGNDANSTTWSLPNSLKGHLKVQSGDVLYKNTFELEPAKQGYQSCNTIDSSRMRLNTAADQQYVKLDKDVIEFPKSEETFPISRYTPKASWEHKNVCTDKSKLDMNKPNMVTTSFGINIHTTRCFNWISAGDFDEFVWLRPQGSSTWTDRFESYKPSGETDAPGSMTKVSFPEQLKAAAYNRLHGIFPAANVRYTSHKCIINVVPASVAEPAVYEYVVGRADKNMQPDPNHSSNVQRFTLYPNTYTPRIFQTTDQQGFHWVEYQAWAAAAIEINKLINTTVQNENIIPILVNTGDMTQNGTRVNEWLDYYNAGQCLFDHLEQMNIVGNNDLVGTDPEILGTGDDNGKSNGHYFHVFYCYEVDPSVNPIIPASDGSQVKYIPSFYYFQNEGNDDAHVQSYRFVFLNTEITMINCRDWYKRVNASDEPINVYTGWPIVDSTSAVYDSGFKTIYSMIYEVLLGARRNNQFIIAACHEMPFTVVTNANLAQGKKGDDRSMNGSSLVGCHCNRLGPAAERSIYWLSRLLENFEVKLMIGGHKHTYACTNKLREFYYYEDGAKNSLQDGPMVMEPTLEHDNLVSWSATLGKVTDGSVTSWTLEAAATAAETAVFNTTKFPIMEVAAGVDEGVCINSGTLWPCYGLHSTDRDESTGVFDYIHDEESWNESFQNGGLHDYYNRYPDNDRYNTQENRPALETDKIDGEWPEYCVQSWDGAIGADGAKYPWIVLKLPVSFRGTIKLSYEGKEDAYPWGEGISNFSYGYADVSIPEVFGNEFLLQSGETTFDVSKFSATLIPSDYAGTTYMMCQATGFKLKSNKELPSSQQKFSYVIPHTDNSGSSDAPNDNQLKPMFVEVVLDGDSYDVYIARIEEITNGTKLFSQQAFSTKPAKFMYLKGNEAEPLGDNNFDDPMYGHWVNNKVTLVEL